MKCAMCKGHMQSQSVTHTADMGECIVVVRNVPAMVCSQCGEVWYSGTVVRQLESIVEAVMKAALTEVAVVSYADKAA